MFSFALLSGCARVTIVDSTWYGDLGSQGAVGFHTLTPGEIDVPKAIWDVERIGMVCTTADTFANWKAVIEDLCAYSNDCDYATKQQIAAFFDKIDMFHKRVIKMRKR